MTPFIIFLIFLVIFEILGMFVSVGVYAEKGENKEGFISLVYGLIWIFVLIGLLLGW